MELMCRQDKAAELSHAADWQLVSSSTAGGRGWTDEKRGLSQ